MHSHHASDPQDDQGTDLAYHGDSLLNSLHSAYVVLFLPLFLRHTFSLLETGKNTTVLVKTQCVTAGTSYSEISKQQLISHAVDTVFIGNITLVVLYLMYTLCNINQVPKILSAPNLKS